MDMHSVEVTKTGLSRAANERPDLKNARSSGHGHDARLDESAQLPGTHGSESMGSADRVEISDVSKVLAALSEQQDDSGDLQLPTDKLRRMIEG